MPLLRWAGIALAAFLLLFQALPAATQEIFWPTSEHRCFDVAKADTLLFANHLPENGRPRGSYAYSLASGEFTALNNAPFSLCNPASGLLYAHPEEGAKAAEGSALLFSLDEPRPLAIAHMPSHLAADGSLWAYAWSAATLGEPAALWASPDGGRSWQPRTLPVGQNLINLAVASTDGRALYLLAGDMPDTGDIFSYSVFFSADAGANWEERGAGQIPNNPFPPNVTIRTFASAAAPVENVIIMAATGYDRYSTLIPYLSTDGGETFRNLAAGERPGPDELRHSNETALYYTSSGLLRLSGDSYSETMLERSSNGGLSWERIQLPFAVYRDPMLNSISIMQAFTDPDVLAALDTNRIYWLSTDSGRSWEPMQGVSSVVEFSRSLPLRVVTHSDTGYELREVAGAE